MIIHCTAKLLKEMGVSEANLSGGSSKTGSPLSDWYANLFFVHRKKYIIFVNSATSLTFILPDVSRKETRDLKGLFAKGFSRLLIDEKLENPIIRDMERNCHGVNYAKATDRSVIGIMVEHVKAFRYFIDYSEDQSVIDISGIVHHLNRTPLLTRKYCYAIEEFTRLINSAGGIG